MDYKQRLNVALNEIRFVRNNVYKEDFEQMIKELVQDGNLRYPLMLASQVAIEAHKEQVRINHENELAC